MEASGSSVAIGDYELDADQECKRFRVVSNARVEWRVLLLISNDSGSRQSDVGAMVDRARVWKSDGMVIKVFRSRVVVVHFLTK
jgi:hypothetical protein